MQQYIVIINTLRLCREDPWCCIESVDESSGLDSSATSRSGKANGAT